jgi:hypothetical protein
VKILGGEHGDFRLRARRRLTRDELDATGRAPRLSTTRVQLIDAGIFLERQDKPLA